MSNISKQLLLIGFVFFGFVPKNSLAQCNTCTFGGTKFPANSLTPTLCWQTQAGINGGTYAEFNIVAGRTYFFSYCTANGASANFDTRLILFNGTTYLTCNSDYGCTPATAARVDWTATYTGVVRVRTLRYVSTANQCASTGTGAVLAYKEQCPILTIPTGTTPGTLTAPGPIITNPITVQWSSPGTTHHVELWDALINNQINLPLSADCINGLSYTLPTLTSGQYKWSVHRNQPCDCCEGSPTTDRYFQVGASCTTPGTPASAAGTATGQTTANLSWTAGTPAGSPTVTYYWVVGTSPTVTYGNGVDQGTTTSTSVSTSLLTCATQYYLRVYASTSCNNTNSGYRTSTSFTTSACNPNCITPGTPAIATGTATGQTSAILSWTAGNPVGSPTVTYYWVVGTSANVTYGNGVAQGTSTTLSASTNLLTCATQYYLRVYASTSCNGTNSGYRTSAAFTTSACNPNCTPPAIPTGLSAIPVSSSQINLSWNPVVTATGYDVYYCDGTYITYTTNTSFPHTGRTANTNYSYKIRAQINANCVSNYTSCISATTFSIQTFTNCSGLCNDIEILTPKSHQNNIYPRYVSPCSSTIGFNSETLLQYNQSFADNIPINPEFSWTSVFQASYYVVELASQNGQRITGYNGYLNATTLIANCTVYSPTLFRLTQPLNYSTTYQFKVLAYNASNTLISCSNILTFKTTAPFTGGNSLTHGFPHGHYKNIICRENEPGTCTAWECKEFVKRFLRDAKGINMSPGSNSNSIISVNADAFALGGLSGVINTNPQYGIKFYPNNSNIAPKPDDIIFSYRNSDDQGHVSILRVLSGQYKVAQQNWTNGNSTTHEFGNITIQSNSGNWIASFGSNYTISGWGRLSVARNCIAGYNNVQGNIQLNNVTAVSLDNRTPTFSWSPSVPGAAHKALIYKQNRFCWNLIHELPSTASSVGLSPQQILSPGIYRIKISATPSSLGSNYGTISSDYFYFSIANNATTYVSNAIPLINLVQAMGSYASNVYVEAKDSIGWNKIGKTKSNGTFVIDEGYLEYKYDSARLISVNYDTASLDRVHFEKYGKAIVPLFQSNSGLWVRNFTVKTADGEFISTQATKSLFFKGDNVVNYYWVEYLSGADGLNLPIPNQTTAIFHSITNGNIGTIPLEVGFNQIEFAAVGLVDTAYVSLKLQYYPSSVIGNYARRVTFNTSQNLIKANLYVGDEFVSSLNSISQQKYLPNNPVIIRISKYGYRDTLFVADTSEILLNINLTPINYSSTTDSIVLDFNNSQPKFWKTASIKNKGVNRSLISFKQYDDAFTGMSLRPQTRKFAFRNLIPGQQVLLKTIIALDQINTPDSNTIYLLNIKNGNRYYKSKTNTPNLCQYNYEFQKVSFDSLNFRNNAATEEIVLMEKQAPIMKTPAIIYIHSGETLSFPLSYFVSDPDSIKNDISLSSTDVKVRIVGATVYITAPVGFTGNATFTLTATHDFLDVSKDFKMKVMPPGIYVPTGFTPNNDGLNDDLNPKYMGKLLNCHFTLFNRYGQKVFETTDCTKGWDGKINGIEQPTGTFVWMLSYQFDGEAKKEMKGTTTLIR